MTMSSSLDVEGGSVSHALGVFLHRLFYWSVVHFAYGMVVRPVVVWWCEHVRPYPIPSGPIATCRGPLGEVCEGGGSGLVSLFCGDRVAQNEHIGLVLHPCEEVEREEESERRVGQAGRFPYNTSRGDKCIQHHRPFATLAEATAYAVEKKLLLVVLVHSELNRLSRSLLAEVVGRDTCNIQTYLCEKVVFYLVSALGGECGQLSGLQGISLPALVVYAPTGKEEETNDGEEAVMTPQSSVAPAASPQRDIDPREAARAAVLRRLAASKQANMREDGGGDVINHDGDAAPTTAASPSPSFGSGGLAVDVTWGRYALPGREPVTIPFVASMEGVSSVVDAYGFLRECEKQYTQW